VAASQQDDKHRGRRRVEINTDDISAVFSRENEN
jgi:hypothetical protein